MAWMLALGTAAAGIYSGMQEDDRLEAGAQKSEEQLSHELQNKAFMSQQERKYLLEDRNRKMQAVGGFQKFAPEGAMNFNGAGAPVTPAQYDTTNLAAFDPSKPGSLMQYMKDHPDG